MQALAVAAAEQVEVDVADRLLVRRAGDPLRSSAVTGRSEAALSTGIVTSRLHEHSSR